MALISGIVLVAILVLIQKVDPAQEPPEYEPYQYPDTLANADYDLDSLLSIIGDNKGLPPGYEIAAAIAYTAYPELREMNIDMVFTDYGPPMMADIDVWSLFGFRNNRRYIIKLNDNQGVFDPILLRALPFDAQIGILAHELGHVAYYHRLNVFEFGKWGISYLMDDAFHATHERTTDLMPVYHGLGSQIYQYAHYVRYDPSCVELYARGKGFMDKYYMTDKELLPFIENH